MLAGSMRADLYTLPRLPHYLKRLLRLGDGGICYFAGCECDIVSRRLESFINKQFGLYLIIGDVCDQYKRHILPRDTGVST